MKNKMEREETEGRLEASTHLNTLIFFRLVFFWLETLPTFF